MTSGVMITLFFSRKMDVPTHTIDEFAGKGTYAEIDAVPLTCSSVGCWLSFIEADIFRAPEDVGVVARRRDMNEDVARATAGVADARDLDNDVADRFATNPSTATAKERNAVTATDFILPWNSGTARIARVEGCSGRMCDCRANLGQTSPIHLNFAAITFCHFLLSGR